MKKRVTKIVIVDDSPLVRAGLKTMLSARDIRIVGEADTFASVLSLLDGLVPDLVLVGLLASDPAFFDFLGRLKEKWPRLSVVIVTPSESSSRLSRALALGCSGYFHWQVEREQLVKAIRAISRGECIVDPKLLKDTLKDLAAEEAGLGQKALGMRLTPVERNVLRLITEGQTNGQIAERLHYSVGTVKDYVQRIIQKLEVSDRTQAAVKALRLGIID